MRVPKSYLRILKFGQVSVAALVLMTACPQKSKKQGAIVVEPEGSSMGLLYIKSNWDSKVEKYIFEIKDLPDQTKLYCRIDSGEEFECLPNFSRDLIDDGGITHILEVEARKDSVLIALGELRFSKNRTRDSTPQQANYSFATDLTLKLDDSTLIEGKPYSNGMAIDVTKSHEIHFRFIKQPVCSPVVRCQTLSAINPTWPLCDSPNHKSFAPDEMPLGLQFMRISTACGDQKGEPLTLYWYGVGPNYVYMSVKSEYLVNARGDKQYFYSLEKESDCTRERLTWQCQGTPQEDFKLCKPYRLNPSATFKIKPLCSG